MSIASQIRALKAKKSAEQLQVLARDAERRARSFGAQLETQRDPTTLMDLSFLGQLRAKAKLAQAGVPPRPRTDLGELTASLRAKGILASPDDPEKVGYVPTPEEVLGEDAEPATTVLLPHRALDSDCPPADRVLGGAAPEVAPGPAAAAPAPAYAPGDLTPEELAEIDRLNPRRPAAPAKAMKGARPLRNPSR